MKTPPNRLRAGIEGCKSVEDHATDKLSGIPFSTERTHQLNQLNQLTAIFSIYSKKIGELMKVRFELIELVLLQMLNERMPCLAEKI